MDPKANLEEQLILAGRLVEMDPDTMDSSAAHSALDDAARLAELVIALDIWIIRNGFLPPH